MHFNPTLTWDSLDPSPPASFPCHGPARVVPGDNDGPDGGASADVVLMMLGVDGVDITPCILSPSWSGLVHAPTSSTRDGWPSMSSCSRQRKHVRGRGLRVSAMTRGGDSPIKIRALVEVRRDRALSLHGAVPCCYTFQKRALMERRM